MDIERSNNCAPMRRRHASCLAKQGLSNGDFLLVGAFVLAVCLIGCSHDKTTSSPKGDWVRFSSAEGRFSVLMPTTPTHKAEKQTTVSGEITLHNWTSEVNGTVAYSLLWNDMPESARGTFQKVPPEVLLDGGQKAALGNDGRLLTQRDFKYQGHPARELQFVRFRNALLTMRMYWVGNRVYQTMSVMPTNRASPRDIARFLDSFTLKEGK